MRIICYYYSKARKSFFEEVEKLLIIINYFRFFNNFPILVCLDSMHHTDHKIALFSFDRCFLRSRKMFFLGTLELDENLINKFSLQRSSYGAKISKIQKITKIFLSCRVQFRICKYIKFCDVYMKEVIFEMDLEAFFMHVSFSSLKCFSSFSSFF